MGLEGDAVGRGFGVEQGGAEEEWGSALVLAVALVELGGGVEGLGHRTSHQGEAGQCFGVGGSVGEGLSVAGLQFAESFLVDGGGGLVTEAEAGGHEAEGGLGVVGHQVEGGLEAGFCVAGVACLEMGLTEQIMGFGGGTGQAGRLLEVAEGLGRFAQVEQGSGQLVEQVGPGVPVLEGLASEPGCFLGVTAFMGHAGEDFVGAEGGRGGGEAAFEVFAGFGGLAGVEVGGPQERGGEGVVGIILGGLGGGADGFGLEVGGFGLRIGSGWVGRGGEAGEGVGKHEGEGEGQGQGQGQGRGHGGGRGPCGRRHAREGLGTRLRTVVGTVKRRHGFLMLRARIQLTVLGRFHHVRARSRW